MLRESQHFIETWKALIDCYEYDPLIMHLACAQVERPTSSRGTYTFIASDGPRTYVAYVCAEDTRGSRACTTDTFTLLENPDFTSEEAEFMLSEIGFDNLLSTGDDDAVYQVRWYF